MEITGTFIANPRGFGFVSVEGESEDFFIPGKYCKDAFHLDTVVIEPVRPAGGRRRRAKVVKVIERHVTEVVGTYEKNKNFGFVCPDDVKIFYDIFVPKGKDMGAKKGMKVVCTITSYGGDGKNPEGYISDIIGQSNKPHVDIISLAMAFGNPADFPEDVQDESEAIPSEVSGYQRRGRLDLRDELIITIDGDDSKDFDDAVSIEKIKGGYRLGVHIADVTQYVKEKTALDREAYNRGTSVYLPGLVIPMLPEKLSNGICSLNEGVDRLTLSCIMDFDEKGKQIDHKIVKSVIKSKKRMTYSGVNSMLENPDGKFGANNREVMPMLFLMKELSELLYQKRAKRGSIDLDVPEPYIILDKRGKTEQIIQRERGVAERIIEEFMLAANETVATEFYNRGIPFLYRYHPAPEPEKVKDLSLICAVFGIKIKGNKTKIHPKEFQKIMEAIKGKPQETLVSACVLRSMQQAKYSPDNPDHFGLAAEYYCHFTSPIRRYPDLMVHRIIKEVLTKPITAKRFKYYTDILPSVADHSSKKERKAIECEREANKLKMAEYMFKRLGQEYNGIISGVTSFGLYVQLNNTIEGMIPISALGRDHYVHVEKEYAIIGENSGECFRLGDPVRVMVEWADTQQRTIDFSLVRNVRKKRKNNSNK